MTKYIYKYALTILSLLGLGVHDIWQGGHDLSGVDVEKNREGM